MQQSFLNIAKERRKLVLGLILVTIAVNAVVASVIEFENNFVYYDILRIAIVGAGTILSLVIFAKQGYHGLFGRAYTALAIGLIMYLAAELTWGYYEIALAEESPFPSVADVFYLIGYAGFGYFQFSMLKFYGKGTKKSVYYLVIPLITVLSFLYLQSLISLYGFSQDDDRLVIALSVAYPVLDSIIFVPAILIILNSWKGQLTFIPWIFMSWVLSGAADILFGYSSIPQFNVIFPAVTMTYNAAYLCMAAGLIWHLRFFLSGERKAPKS